MINNSIAVLPVGYPVTALKDQQLLHPGSQGPRRIPLQAGCQRYNCEFCGQQTHTMAPLQPTRGYPGSMPGFPPSMRQLQSEWQSCRVAAADFLVRMWSLVSVIRMHAIERCTGSHINE
eukprot:5506141-Pyramimonas_sp.AAC.3